MLTYGAMVFALMAILLFCCSWLGEKKGGREKERAYESGIIPTGLALLRSPAAFYMVAVFFLIFDVEAAFIFSWAVSFYGLGWAGWIQMTFFIVLLLFGAPKLPALARSVGQSMKIFRNEIKTPESEKTDPEADAR
ncbi:MAG: NADH-quinone oxidoreductase subunit A, partial [Deltaproteobacteria bacterium]|nr:NADH-quinone oxidoreductase subunit A [Deltaproteobacteria bacterium]